MIKIHHAVVLPRVYSILTTRYQVTKIILANLVPITRYYVPVFGVNIGGYPKSSGEERR